MNFTKTFYSILLLIVALNNTITTPTEGVICVPVADLVGEPFYLSGNAKSIFCEYQNIPFCGEKKRPEHACARLHQLLYNDIVEIIKETDEEICIKTNHAFCLTPSSMTPHSTYWTHKKNVFPLEKLNNISVNSNHIPQAINYNYIPNNDQILIKQAPIVTLIMPHYEPILNITFSAGTRFVHNNNHKNDPHKINVFIVDYQNNKTITTDIPRDKCMFSSQSTPPDKRINHYVNLLRKWTHLKDGFIPYTWGGTSFITTMNSPFIQVEKNKMDTTYSWYAFANDTTYPKAGFDCSGLILRATQICNIPYFCKNTTTINLFLEPLQKEDTLINGDLIFFKGHVMVVSDIDHNLLIEARGYGGGYGKLHEIPLKQMFEGVITYQNLCEAFFNQKPLRLKDIHGKISSTYNNWKIFKIKSVFKKKIGAPNRI